MVFHGFWLVYMVFNVVSWFFHGFWLVSMVFEGGFMVSHGFWLISIVFQGGFMVFGWFPWFCWFRTPQNCILAQQSSLGLAGRRPALA